MASVSREKMELPTSKPVGGHSTFNNGYPLAGTYRFGQIQPHFVQEVVPDDDIELSTSYKLDSYTLSQPLMQDLFITHGYYFVPMPALLPRNYEKFITNPNIGDDIDAEQVGLSYDFNNLKKFFSNLLILSTSYADPNELDDPEISIAVSLRWLLAYDMIYGLGGLPATLGYKFISSKTQQDFDELLSEFNDAIFSSSIVSVLSVPLQNYPRFDNLHDFFEFVRDDFSFEISISSDDSLYDIAHSLIALIADFLDVHPLPSPKKRINVQRILAYQILCAHFFTNDKVDYIYSADLWRQNVIDSWWHGSFCDDTIGEGSIPTFVYNGLTYQYDDLSSYLFDFVTGSSYDVAIGDCQYLRLLFGFNYSLRHVDYFTGSRTRPLAVGDVGVRVNDGVVNVVENIQTTWFAKFLNQVNRTGRRINNYIKGLFPGAAISQDWHDPIWLGDTTDKIRASEVDNTGEAQQSNKNSITSTLNSNAAKYGFRYQNTQYYGVIIGVVYFDLERFYTEVNERPIFHVDRFDMFNPFLQFNGDQEIYGEELSVSEFPVEGVFGYQSRYLEYKQRVPQAFGGFITDPVLSKSIFLADTEKKDITGYMMKHISPSYIRSHPLEFDKYYLSLTGFSLASYFHFQIIHWNRVKSVRPMVYNPQLG